MAVKRNKSRRPASSAERPALTSLQQALLDEADRKVTIVSEGEQQEVSIHQVVSRKLLQTAANGSVHALSNAFNEINAAQQLHQQQINDDVELGQKYKDLQQQLLDQALAKGEDPEKVLPHPDDIKVLPGKGFKIAGPSDETELITVRECCALRDVLILQSVLEERIGEPAVIASTENTGEPFAGALAMVLAQVMNHSLPKRFIKSETELTYDLMHHNRWTKRELLRETHRAWTAIGRPKPRGWVLPPYQQSLVRIGQYLSLCADLFKLAQDGKLNSDREIEAELQNRISRNFE
ncbi:hypothetical protein [Labrenzia sp. PHM005]|uniref:hypothetical protein n=1 Tax=Labrenzia sp. PHM005 TaxID=2590016 RepID=UPI0011403F64|nr:hypothetical protein [Labrenzia sp. PHM005]QDG78507.1 hypothetical protein FJ695_23065 [Labrenzia sp. PHM005]